MMAMLAYSFDQRDPLTQLDKELESVQTLLQTGWCTPVPWWKCGPAQIRQFFDTYREQVGILHFAGHAQKAHWMLNDPLEETRLSFVEALAAHICQYGGLRLVFLNGCSTEEQAAAFHAQGVPLVIATTLPLKDRYGLAFARLFYTEFCTRHKTVREAFRDTLHGFRCDYQAEQAHWTDPGLADRMRGLDLDDGPESGTEPPIYRLLEHPVLGAAAAERRFADWNDGRRQADTVPQQDRPRQQQNGVAPDSYLLCDRSEQVGTFQREVTRKLRSGDTGPLFFFIHDDDRHCPFELQLRLHRYPVRQLPVPVMRTVSLEGFGLPFTDEDLNVTALSECFAADLPAVFDPHRNRHVLRPMVPEPSLLLVCHDLGGMDWEAGWADFFRDYIERYAPVLGSELSGRLAILFLREYYESDDPFQELFDRLARRYPGRAFNLSRLPLVTPGHIGQWQREVFRETFVSLSALFGPDGGDPADRGIPFLEAKERLSDLISAFNARGIRAEGGRPG